MMSMLFEYHPLHPSANSVDARLRCLLVAVLIIGEFEKYDYIRICRIYLELSAKVLLTYQYKYAFESAVCILSNILFDP